MEKQLRIVRKKDEKGHLGFQVSFDPGDDAGDSLFLPWDAFEKFKGLAKEFSATTGATEIIQRWASTE